MKLSIGVGAVLAGVAILLAFDPATTWWFPSCPLYAITGWQCPLCGSLRALHALVHGAPLVALAFNPLTTVGIPAGLITFGHDVMWRRRTPQLHRLVALGLSPVGLTVALVFTVLRNMR
jgi:hypothetical protein